MTPTLGRIVLYALNHSDVEQIERRRTTGKSIAERITTKEWPTGAQAHIGNSVSPSQLVPAIITAVWSETCVNLRCILDGSDEFWATSRNLYTPTPATDEQAASPSTPPMGCWAWPARS